MALKLTRDKLEISSPPVSKKLKSESSFVDKQLSGSSDLDCPDLPAILDVGGSNLPRDDKLEISSQGSKLKSETCSDSPLCGQSRLATASLTIPELEKLLTDPVYSDLCDQIMNDPAYLHLVKHLNAIVGALAEDIPPQFDLEAYSFAFRQVVDNPQLFAKIKRFGIAFRQVNSIPEDRITHANDSVASMTECPAAMKRTSCERDIFKAMVQVCKRTIARVRTTFEVPDQLHNDAEGMGNKVAVVSEADIIKPGKVKRTLSEAEIKKMDYVGRTRLHLACSKGKVKKAEYLIYKGVAVNALDIAKNTALHYAAGCGREKCVELLITHGADVDLKNVHNKTPYEIAVINRHTNVMDLMKKLLEKKVE